MDGTGERERRWLRRYSDRIGNLIGTGQPFWLHSNCQTGRTCDHDDLADLQLIRIGGTSARSGPSELFVPRSAPCLGPLAFGTNRTVTRSTGMPGVRINMVAAQHTDGIFNPAGLMTAPLGGYMNENGLVGYDGLANGFVLTFTNGLKVYLTGDTGPTSDMALVVRDFYHPNLAVVNVDGVNSMGPEETAYAMKQLVQPAAVIPSHAEEQVTTGGAVRPDSRTAQFMQLLGDIPAYVPLSGTTLGFDGDANCVAGCSQGTLAEERMRRRSELDRPLGQSGRIVAR